MGHHEGRQGLQRALSGRWRSLTGPMDGIPHHELWFLKGSAEGLQSLLAGLWVKACEKAGLIAVNDEKLVDAFMQHGVDVKEDVDCGDYLAKARRQPPLGVCRRVIEGHQQGRPEPRGVHPHHFLVRKAPGDRALHQYVQAMKGRRQLFWSNGLKAQVGVDDVSDEVLADESQAAEILGRMTTEDWGVVRKRCASRAAGYC